MIIFRSRSGKLVSALVGQLVLNENTNKVWHQRILENL